MPEDWTEELAEQLAPKGKRESRRERKRLTQADRSKHKKSDLEKRKASAKRKAPQGPLARVLSITAEGMIVDHEGRDLLCTLRRGLLTEQRRRVKSLVTIGDLVTYELTGHGEGVITDVAERYSFLSRAEHLKRKRQQLIAANIDQVLICASLVTPPLKPALVDRYIIAARKGNMQPVIIVNKIDLLEEASEEERALYDRFCQLYAHLGYPVLRVSVPAQQGLDALHSVMHDKASVFSGQSGVGKSSLINAVTGLALPVGEVVERTRKGVHTTTTAQLIRLEGGGFCIDTPGIRSFGVWELSIEDLRHHFTDIAEHAGACRFPNCTHTHEPGCAVLKALEDNLLSPVRFRSYCALLGEIGSTERPR